MVIMVFFFSVYVLCIDVNLRSIESSFSHIFHKWDIEFLKHLSDMAFCFFPYRSITNVFLCVSRIPLGKMEVLHAFLFLENLKTVLCKSDTVLKLFYHLVRLYTIKCPSEIVNSRTRIGPYIFPESSLRKSVDVSP